MSIGTTLRVTLTNGGSKVLEARAAELLKIAVKDSLCFMLPAGAILPLFPRRLQLPIPLGLSLLLMPLRESLLAETV